MKGLGESQEHQAVGDTVPTFSPAPRAVGRYHQPHKVLPRALRIEGVVWNYGATWDGFLEEGCGGALCCDPIWALSLSSHHRGEYTCRWAHGSEQARNVPDTHQQI